MRRALDIEALEAPPIVGRRYWVPCVRAKGMLWPVIGPQHADADLGVPEEHLHCDARFMNNRQVQHNLDLMFAAAAEVPGAWLPKGEDQEQAFELVRRSPLAATLASTVAFRAAGMRPPTLHLRVCKREAGALGVGWFLPALERQHATARAVDCRVCPHRGTPLSSLPVDGEGGVVCPAHGLRWSKATGFLMPRTCPPNLPTPAAARRYREALSGDAERRVATGLDDLEDQVDPGRDDDEGLDVEQLAADARDRDDAGDRRELAAPAKERV